MLAVMQDRVQSLWRFEGCVHDIPPERVRPDLATIVGAQAESALRCVREPVAELVACQSG